jgi:DNA-binding response OmpR family regulator
MAKQKILVVDDDADVRAGLNIRLRASGYNVVLAADALTAVQVARKESPDLLILDLGLPGGDGFLVMQRLSAIPALAVIPVIVLSARDRESHENRVTMAGAVAFLQKPFDDVELLEVIRKTLGGGDETTGRGRRATD